MKEAVVVVVGVVDTEANQGIQDSKTRTSNITEGDPRLKVVKEDAAETHRRRSGEKAPGRLP